MGDNVLESLKKKKKVVKLSVTALISAVVVYGGTAMFSASAMVPTDERPNQVDIADKGLSESVQLEEVGTSANSEAEGFAALQVEAEFVVDGIRYSMCSSDTVSVVGLQDSDMEVVNIKKKVEYEGLTYDVDSIRPGAFQNGNVKIINLPEEGINIDWMAFDGAKKLTTVNNLEKAKILKSEALFRNCDSLESVRLPEDLTTLGDEMFFGCTSLKSIDIGKNVTCIGDESFCGCFSLENINMTPDSALEKIGKGAFAGCKRFRGFVFPVEGFVFPRLIKEIGDFAFMDCDALGSVNVGADVKIGRCSFSKSCKVIGARYEYDEKLEEQNKQLDDFVERVLQAEAEKGRDLNERVNNAIIDKILYEYVPKTKDGKSATDAPEVVSKEEFEKGKEGKLVLYRGQTGFVNQDGEAVMTCEEVIDRFKRGSYDFYLTRECNGIFCTRSVDHARTYGKTLQFYFKDEPKVITDEETFGIVAFYKYRHIENYMQCMEYHPCCVYAPFSILMKNLGVGSMQAKTFVPRALGYDVQWDITCDGIGRDGNMTKDMLTTQYEVFYRSKLVVCEEDVPGFPDVFQRYV